MGVRRARLRVRLAAALGAALVAAVTAGCTGSANAVGNGRVVPLNRISTLRTLFNQAHGKTRLVLILSPT
jgi:hypothetical protein